MKKFLLASATIALFGCAQDGPQTITANIEGLPDGQVLLKTLGENALETLDSAQVTGGQFTFTIDKLPAQILVFEFQSGEPSVGLFWDGNAVEMTGKVDSLPMVEASGSVFQDSLEVFNTFNRNLRMKFDQLNQAYMQAMQTGDAMGMAAVQKEGAALDSLNQAYAKAFARRNTVLGAYLVNNFIYEPELELMQAIKDATPVEHGDAPDLVKLTERIETVKKTEIGSAYIDFTLSDTTGAPVTLASKAAKGYLLVDFWASWCQPCRVTNPTLVGIFNTYQAKGFDIIGVSLDEDGNKWKEAIRQDQLAWSHVSDLRGWQSEAAKLYGVRFIPQSFLLDPNGRIVLKNPTMDELRNYLNANLASM